MASVQHTTLSRADTSRVVHKRRILIAADDESMRRMLTEPLEYEGYEVQLARDCQQTLELASTFLPDLLLLGTKMPDVDGFEVARRLRTKSTVPIIMVSAHSDGADIDVVAGLSAGSDAYVIMPVPPRELLLRIQAVLRRAEASAVAEHRLEGDLRFDDLIIRPRLHAVELNGARIDLSANEFDLLYFLAIHPRQVFTREQLLDQVWHYQYFGDCNTVTVHMSRLRKKVEPNPANSRHLHTVWNVGYKFDP